MAKVFISYNTVQYCNWWRPSRSKRLTFNLFYCYVSAQELPSHKLGVGNARMWNVHGRYSLHSNWQGKQIDPNHLHNIYLWNFLPNCVCMDCVCSPYAQKTFTYTYDMYGMFWGISTMAVGFLGVVYGTYICSNFIIAYLVHKMSSRSITTGWPGVYNLLRALIFIGSGTPCD